MGNKKKMKLIPFLSSSKCIGGPKTVSFRAEDVPNMLKIETLANGCDFPGISPPDDDHVDQFIKGLRSDRLFFDPPVKKFMICDERFQNLDGEDSGEDLSAEVVAGESLFQESVAMSLDSTDPFQDFRRSMEEMIKSHHHQHHEQHQQHHQHDVLDWDFLEELLTCYLRINGRKNHGYIVGAFVDLLVFYLSDSAHSSVPTSKMNHQQPDTVIASSSTTPTSSSTTCSCSDENCLLSCTNSHSFTSPLSFCSSTSSSCPVDNIV